MYAIRNQKSGTPKKPIIKSSKCLGKLFAEPGDIITFGSYPYTNSQLKSSIKWLVLDKQDKKILIISKDALDAKPYNKDNVDTTWKECTLRNWLNRDFYFSAFSADEKKSIVQTKVSAERNSTYNTLLDNNITDNVFLLSINEVNKYFSTCIARQCAATDCAVAQGAHTSSEYTIGGRPSCWWWLRSPGGYITYAPGARLGGSRSYTQCNAANVEYNGSVGCRNVGSRGCVRPALWISLEA